MSAARARAILALACLCGAAASSTRAADQPANPAIRVTLLGIGSGPPVRVGVAGISTIVEAGSDRFLFDAGRGVMERMVQAGLPIAEVTKLFLTHLHSDHVIEIPDLMLSPWSGPTERKTPLEVWGPEGTSDMMRHLQEAFAFDIHVRRDVDERASPEGIRVIARDIPEGKAYEKNGVTITAFLVDHGPVKPAYGYRLDFAGRAVCLSGDTRPSANLMSSCKGVDLLIHEAVDPDALRRLAPSERLFAAIVAHHTTPEQAAEVFTRVAPRLAVFSHAAGTAAIVERTRRGYPGRVEMGEDLMVIEIGDEVRVERPATGTRDRAAKISR